MAKNVRAKLGKSKAKSKAQQWIAFFRKTPFRSSLALLIVLGIIYIALFAEPKTKEQAQLETNIDMTVAEFEKRSVGLKEKTIEEFPKDDQRAALEELWKSFTPWQRKSTLKDVFTFLHSKDLPDNLNNILKVESMMQLLASAIPEIRQETFSGEHDRVWTFYDNYVAGKHNDEEVLGESKELFDTVLKSNFWGGLEIFSDAAKTKINRKSWLGVREVMLPRFFFVFARSISYKHRQVKDGKELTFPPEPEPEKEWPKDDPDAQDVAHLTTADFEGENLKTDKIPTPSHTLAAFIAPWCGHCKALKPHIAKAATALKDTTARFGAVDCTKEKPVCDRFGVRGYPTVLYFKDGVKVSDYDGGRDTYGLMKWLNESSRMDGALAEIAEEFKPAPEVKYADEPAARDVVHITDATFDESIKSKKFALLFAYASWCGHCKHMKPDYSSLATSLRDSSVVIGAIEATENPKFAKKFAVKGFPTIIFFKDGKKVEEYQGDRTQAAITAWLDAPTRLNGQLAAAAAVNAAADQGGKDKEL